MKGRGRHLDEEPTDRAISSRKTVTYFPVVWLNYKNKNNNNNNNNNNMTEKKKMYFF